MIKLYWLDGRDDFASGMVALRKRRGISNAAFEAMQAQNWKRAKVVQQIECGFVDEFERRIAFQE